MKTYEFVFYHDNGQQMIQIQADTIDQARFTLLTAEKAPKCAVVSWHVVPTKKQIDRTKNLMRGDLI